jgi:hypothetical protein
MQRSPLQIVSLDILVLAEPKTCNGWASIPQERTAASRVARVRVEPNITYLAGGLDTATLHFPVRVIKDSDVVRNGGLNPELRKQLTSESWDLLRAMNLLLRAEEVKDSKVAEEAYGLCSPLLFGRPQSASDRDFVKLVSSMLSMPANIGSDLDVLISHALANARMVCWGHWNLATAESDAKRPRHLGRAIGIYCSDYRTAIAAKMILGSIRSCFRCHKPFIARRPGQNCCKVECRESHRLARWRARKKSEVRLQQKAASIRQRRKNA